MRRPAVYAVALLLPILAANGPVQAQRDRLPPAPVEGCADELAGVWLDHTYNERAAYWMQHELHIERDPADPSKLTGFVNATGWKGDRAQVQPPPCTGRRHYTVRYPAEGRIDADTITFGGVGEDWELVEMYCGVAGDMVYNLDHFTGTLDRSRQEFQTVNNDGGTAVRLPTVFRRIRCPSTSGGTIETGATPAARSTATVEPEGAPAPRPSDSLGCNLW